MGRTFLQFSLRSVLLAVAFAAIGVAALVNASPWWLTAAVSLSLALLLAGVTLAINGKGPVRAFWTTFVAWEVLYIAIVNPEYIEPLFATLPGLILLVGGGLWMALGIFIMTRMVKIDV